MMEKQPFESNMPKPPAEGAKLKKVYYQVTKNKENGIETTTRHPMPIYEYDNVEGSEHSFLSQASPTIINSAEIAPRRSKTLLLADIPDIHYGFRRLPDGTLQPTHRPEVMDTWLQIMKKEQPNTIIIGGDALDLPQLSKYEMDSLHFIDTLQLSIDGLYKYFSRLRADNPNARIIDLESNHAERFGKFTLKNAPYLFGLKQANMPNDWAVNSYPFMMRLKDLEIEYVNSFQINDRLLTFHGELADRNSTAAKYLGRYATSIMFHHDHRRGYERRVFPDGKAIEAFGFGCQADTTGSVPSYNSDVDTRGYVVPRCENWSNGGGFIEYKQGDRPFNQTAVPIEAQDNYEAVWGKKVYKAREDVTEALRNGK